MDGRTEEWCSLESVDILSNLPHQERVVHEDGVWAEVGSDVLDMEKNLGTCLAMILENSL